MVFMNFNPPQFGHEQAGHRPAIVISSQIFNKGTFLFACPITKQEKGYPFEVKLPRKLSVQGVILADQLRSLDWRPRNLTFKCEAPVEIIEECSHIINEILK
ncbi:type II toxin-antitoxin system PemK/MazF family toxin [Gracilibacillus boraciitolerans]|nr:type II toxin-antitoxin system PemK/MazF family toxin [Gracilibacillus boraciitolerans]